MLNVYLKIMYILLSLGTIFYKHQYGHLNSIDYYMLTDFQKSINYLERGIEIAIVFVNLTISSCRSINFSFMYFEALLIGAICLAYLYPLDKLISLCSFN